MFGRVSIARFLLKLLLVLLMASPLIGLCAGFFLQSSPGLTPSQIVAETMPKALAIWFLAVCLYAVGFWLTFLLLRRGVLCSRAAFLWWCSLLFGVLAAVFVPVGTAVALPSLIILFQRRSLYFRRVDHAV